jgi:signal transduction histidine kinase
MAAEHGKQRFRVGYDVVEIIKEYGILREVILDIADAHNVVVAGLGGRVFHFTFSQAVAAAAMSYQEEKEAELRHRRKEYLAFVMHDLKTPLNAIMVAAEVVQERLDDPKIVSEMNGVILRNAEKLDELLKQTILVSKATELEETDRLMPRHIELWPVVQSVIDEFKLVASVDKTHIHNLVPSTFTVYADAPAIRSVIRNLLSNAMKYAAGGKIVIGVSKSRKGEVDIWIRDNGVGIPEERQEFLFSKLPPDPLHKSSTGLGLLMVKKIVEAHHGRVCIESKMGEGTTVRITLPVAQASKQ